MFAAKYTLKLFESVYYLMCLKGEVHYFFFFFKMSFRKNWKKNIVYYYAGSLRAFWVSEALFNWSNFLTTVKVCKPAMKNDLNPSFYVHLGGAESYEDLGKKWSLLQLAFSPSMKSKTWSMKWSGILLFFRYART